MGKARIRETGKITMWFPVFISFVFVSEFCAHPGSWRTNGALGPRHRISRMRVQIKKKKQITKFVSYEAGLLLMRVR